MCTSNGSNGDGPDSDKRFTKITTNILVLLAALTFLFTVPGGIAAVQPAWAALVELKVYIVTRLFQAELPQPAKDELGILEKRIERSGKRMLQRGAAIAPKALLSEKTVHQDADQVIAWKVRSDLSDKLVCQALALRLKELNASVEARHPSRGKHATYDDLLADLFTEQDRLDQYTMAVLIVTLQKLDAPQELYAEYQRRHFV
ncbi:hypothetical protein [Megalodesulfovibrio gigas]|uniref:Uncharacterized protein n=1 Tax=Megalodesulfovibrio gigas (strain ATCC 19364 / DSM 1382 / NCIMB 9332 / VKM B-1759) TaxID=1121448 RepID=T2GEW1_MEGG1|nr:hypothetical protein [Megalodesulfovibrio gigas]AGW14651.1 hypothetical protein DGI_2926 [Megalodesulfovibrio gigas DSM 1382 = ATCC 19364]